MGAWLGPRWNEAIGVRVCDLNPLRKEITFGRVVVNLYGSRTFTESLSKTEDARTIPVPTPVMDVLTAHVDRYVDTDDRDAFLSSPRAATTSSAATSAETSFARPPTVPTSPAGCCPG